VEMHGGSISVESEVNVGTVFEIRLPKTFLSRSVSHAL
jgi:signal transduction histidine kinase